jgi:hypothetical protein
MKIVFKTDLKDNIYILLNLLKKIFISGYNDFSLIYMTPEF